MDLEAYINEKKSALEKAQSDHALMAEKAAGAEKALFKSW